MSWKTCATCIKIGYSLDGGSEFELGLFEVLYSIPNSEKGEEILHVKVEFLVIGDVVLGLFKTKCT